MDITIKLLDAKSSLDEALDRGLYQTIYECFSEPPYNRKITRKTVLFLFKEYCDFGVLHLAYHEKKPIGFLATIPLSKTNDMGELSFLDSWGYWQNEKVYFNQELLTQYVGLSIERFQYVADLGVARGYRRQGIATQLFLKHFSYFDTSMPYILRTIRDPNYSYIVEFYKNLGFKVMPMTQVLEYKNSDGEIIKSDRLICCKIP